jgi:hypothetical protein
MLLTYDDVHYICQCIRLLADHRFCNPNDWMNFVSNFTIEHACCGFVIEIPASNQHVESHADLCSEPRCGR